MTTPPFPPKISASRAASVSLEPPPVCPCFWSARPCPCSWCWDRNPLRCWWIRPWCPSCAIQVGKPSAKQCEGCFRRQRVVGCFFKMDSAMCFILYWRHMKNAMRCWYKIWDDIRSCDSLGWSQASKTCLLFNLGLPSLQLIIQCRAESQRLTGSKRRQHQLLECDCPDTRMRAFPLHPFPCTPWVCQNSSWTWPCTALYSDFSQWRWWFEA